jgi:hypothetical protein
MKKGHRGATPRCACRKPLSIDPSSIAIAIVFLPVDDLAALPGLCWLNPFAMASHVSAFFLTVLFPQPRFDNIYWRT